MPDVGGVVVLRAPHWGSCSPYVAVHDPVLGAEGRGEGGHTNI